MKVNNWDKLENIFHTAIGLPFAEREPFLERECSGDRQLLAEVESLIENFESQPEFLNEPVFELGLGTIHQSTQKNLAGAVIGYYEIAEKIGAGGMGEVYKAFDTRLNRYVALKFLSESLKNETAAKRQLAKEAQAAAALDHPNICAVHGFEQTDEHHFIVMQYIEGKTLAENNGETASGVREFQRLARQIAGAVAFAHSHGIIHRDLKSGNIMLTPNGQIKVLDFGLAKVISQKRLSEREKTDEVSRFSKNGLIVGTVSSMSPEQLRGEKLDYRSDIFSVGIIFYRLITGRNPFSRESQAETIAAILSENPAAFSSLKQLAPDFPERLLKIVEKCLHKEKDARFQSAAEILVELDNAETENLRSTPKNRLALYFKVVFAAIVLFSALGIFYIFNSRPAKRTLAVLPITLENVSTDKEFLADGLTGSVIDKLSGLSDLNVKNETSIALFRGKTVEPQAAGMQLGVDAVFVGTIQNSDDGAILAAKLIRVSDGLVLNTNKFKVEENNPIKLQEDISAWVILKLNSNLTDADRTKLAKRDTENEEARREYIKGRFFLNRLAGGDINEAIRAFTTAKESDPLYTKAWTGLADSYLYLSFPGAEKAVSPENAAKMSKSAANRALELDETLGETYNSLGNINAKYEWDWAKAEDNFRKAIERNPDFVPARVGLIGVLNTQGRFAEALEEAKKIKEIDAEPILPDIELAKIYYRQREYDQMEQILSNLLNRSPNNNRIAATQSYLFLKTGRYNEAIAILEKIYQSEKISDKVFASAPLGFAYAKTERRAEALKIIENLDLFAKTYYVPSQEKAIIYVALGDKDKAFEYLKKSCDERFSTLPKLVTDPIIEDLKSDVRFEFIKQCSNL